MAKRRLTLENFFKGWGLDYSSSNTSAIEAAEQEYSRSVAVDLFRPGKIGHLSPGTAFSLVVDNSSFVNQLAVDAITLSSGDHWIVLKTGRLVKSVFDSNIVSAREMSIAAAHSAHGSVVIDSLLQYKDASEEYFFVAYRDATDSDVARFVKSTGALDQDYMSTVPTGAACLTTGVPHRMIRHIDGNVYITNGRYVSKYNPATTTFTLQALDLEVGFIAADIIPAGRYVLIVTYQQTTYIAGSGRGQSRSVLWDGFSPSYTLPADLEDNYVSALANKGTDIVAFTKGRNNTVKIKKYMGSYWKTLFESAQIGNPPKSWAESAFGQVEEFRGLLCWSDGTFRLLGYGSPDASKIPEGFHYLTRVEESTGAAYVDEVGMIRMLETSNLYVGAHLTPGGYKILKHSDSKYSKNASFLSSLYDLGKLCNIEKADVYFSQFDSGGVVTIDIFRDYISTTGAGLLNRTLTAGSAESRTKMTIDDKLIEGINAFCVKLTWGHDTINRAAAIIRKIVVTYDDGSDSQ